MPIRYLGIDIGQIQTLGGVAARNEVQAKAVLYRSTYRHLLRDTFFRYYATNFRGGRRASGPFTSPILTLSGDAARRSATLNCRKPRLPTPRYLDGLSIVVEAPEAGSLNVSTPSVSRYRSGNRHRNVRRGRSPRQRDDHLAHH